MNRSYLMVAGDKQEHLNKLKILKCDTAVINLEDGVFDKNFARKLLVKNFENSGLKIDGKQIVIRINSLDSFGKKIFIP